jgi:hypothetical protein
MLASYPSQNHEVTGLSRATIYRTFMQEVTPWLT